MIETLQTPPTESTPELSIEQAQQAYELLGSDVHQIVEKLIKLVPESEQEKAEQTLKRTVGYKAIEALIEVRIKENPATERAPHLVIDNVMFFVAGQQNRIDAMSQAALEYLRETYPQFLQTEAPKVIDASRLFDQPPVDVRDLEKAA